MEDVKKYLPFIAGAAAVGLGVYVLS